MTVIYTKRYTVYFQNAVIRINLSRLVVEFFIIYNLSFILYENIIQNITRTVLVLTLVSNVFLNK